jgi:hypothetical protein
VPWGPIAAIVAFVSWSPLRPAGADGVPLEAAALYLEGARGRGAVGRPRANPDNDRSCGCVRVSGKTTLTWWIRTGAAV